MARLKFNMMFNCEQIQIRTLKDLRENFFVEDVLENYNDGTLERWLEARYYSEQLKKVKELRDSNEENARKILETLAKIFEVEANLDELNYDLNIYDYLDERKKFWDYVRRNGLNELEMLRNTLNIISSKVVEANLELDNINNTFSSSVFLSDDDAKKFINSNLIGNVGEYTIRTRLNEITQQLNSIIFPVQQQNTLFTPIIFKPVQQQNELIPLDI